jgi:hypothetical protein
MQQPVAYIFQTLIEHEVLVIDQHWMQARVYVSVATDELYTVMNLPSNCWLFCVTRNHFRRAMASVVLKFNQESNRKTAFEKRKIVFLKNLRYRLLFLERILQE